MTSLKSRGTISSCQRSWETNMAECGRGGSFVSQSMRVSDGKLCVRSGAFFRCRCQAGYSHCYLFACILSRSTRQGTRRFWLPITGPYVVAVPTCLHLCVYLEGIPAAVEDAGGLCVATPIASALPPPVPGTPQFWAKACRRMVVQKS